MKVCLLLLLYSAISIAQNKDSASLYSKNRLRFGLGVGYGAAKIRKDYYKPLVRPTISVMLHQPISSKSQLLHKVMYRSSGYIYPSGSFNGIGYKGYTQLDFAGLSSTYLRTVIPRQPLFLGIGLSAEYLLKDRNVTIHQDGRYYSNSSYKTYRKVNWSGQIVGQYQPRIGNRMRAMLELEYSFGVLNFYRPIATQVSGNKSYSKGVFVTIGVFF